MNGLEAIDPANLAWQAVSQVTNSNCFHIAELSNETAYECIPSVEESMETHS